MARVPSYLVLPVGGAPLDKFILKRGVTPGNYKMESDMPKRRAIMKQLLLALRFLSTLNPVIVHHDLKPSNVVVKEDADGNVHALLIDFGCALKGTLQDQRGGSCATPSFSPPEANGRVAMEQPWHTFDMYAAGMVYMELLCPNLGAMDYVPTPTTLKDIFRKGRCPELGSDEAILIGQMVQNYSTRITPTKALESRVWASAQIPKQQDMAQDLPKWVNPPEEPATPQSVPQKWMYLPTIIRGARVLKQEMGNMWRAVKPLGNKGPGVACRKSRSDFKDHEGMSCFLKWGEKVYGLVYDSNWIMVNPKALLHG
jgi:serine/threonine protein kinase